MEKMFIGAGLDSWNFGLGDRNIRRVKDHKLCSRLAQEFDGDKIYLTLDFVKLSKDISKTMENVKLVEK